MTVRSMTGYGTASLQSERLRATVTIRSLNHRFLDLQVHAPRRLLPLEPEIKECLQARLARGRVEVTVHVDAQGTALAGVTLRFSAGAWQRDIHLARVADEQVGAQVVITRDERATLPPETMLRVALVRDAPDTAHTDA